MSKKSKNAKDILSDVKEKLTDVPHEVPLHRSYGVKKRVSVFTYINNFLPSVLAVIMLSFFGIIIVVGLAALIIMLGHIGLALAVLTVIALIYFVGLRVVRKRLRFIFKLKRRCKALGFKVNFLRGFWKGLRRNTEGFDLTVDTGKKCYCVRYFTSAKFLTHVVFVDEETIAIKRNITRSRLKYVLGFNDPKVKNINYSFKDKMTIYNRKTQKVLLLNPVPHDCFKKDPDGAIIPIGTGEPMFDYIIYSGNSFINTLSRDAKDV